RIAAEAAYNVSHLIEVAEYRKAIDHRSGQLLGRQAETNDLDSGVMLPLDPLDELLGPCRASSHDHMPDAPAPPLQPVKMPPGNDTSHQAHDDRNRRANHDHAEQHEKRGRHREVRTDGLI